MTDVRHLSEEERHGLADGSLDDDRARDAESHLATCTGCADDVTRLRSLMRRMAQSPPPAADLDSLWPDIRARIEAAKVVPLRHGRPSANRRRWWVVGSVAAAAAIVAATTLQLRRQPVPTRDIATTSPGSLSFTSDSARLYRDEAERLLQEMELRRAMLPPATRTTVDDDLRTIDDAITELEAAIARDPSNPALRRLLASSYRQKIELLERARNAG